MAALLIASFYVYVYGLCIHSAIDLDVHPWVPWTTVCLLLAWLVSVLHCCSTLECFMLIAASFARSLIKRAGLFALNVTEVKLH